MDNTLKTFYAEIGTDDYIYSVSQSKEKVLAEALKEKGHFKGRVARIISMQLPERDIYYQPMLNVTLNDGELLYQICENEIIDSWEDAVKRSHELYIKYNSKIDKDYTLEEAVSYMEELEPGSGLYMVNFDDPEKVIRIISSSERGCDMKLGKFLTVKLNGKTIEPITLSNLKKRIESINKESRDDISIGISYTVDLLPEAKYNADQLRKIFYGIENGVDISKYYDPEFDADQMAQIYLGLQHGIDLSVLGHDCDYTKMENIRLQLEKLLEKKSEE
jgi:hypothetical protein